MVITRLLVTLYGILLSASLVIHGLFKQNVSIVDYLWVFAFFLILLTFISELSNTTIFIQKNSKTRILVQTVISALGFLAVSPMIFVGTQNLLKNNNLFMGMLILPLFAFILSSMIVNTKRLLTNDAETSAAVIYNRGVETTTILIDGQTQNDQNDEAVETITELDVEDEEMEDVNDPDRRRFLKLLGIAGAGFLAQTLLNPRQVGAAFFGSVPGPGTIAIKDSSDAKIDPAIKSPTDAYGLTEIDGGVPAYYGFVNKDGNWYIAREEASGSYRYIKGSGSFSVSWIGRALLTYDYFDNVF